MENKYYEYDTVQFARGKTTVCLSWLIERVNIKSSLYLLGKGNNDNHNWLIRIGFPKRKKKTTPKEVAFIDNWMNNYHKIHLSYKSR